VSTGISNGTRECGNISMVLQNFDPSEVLIQRIIKIILGLWDDFHCFYLED
jgi:hypothetical protein